MKTLITVIKPDYTYQDSWTACIPGKYLQLEMVGGEIRLYPLEFHYRPEGKTLQIERVARILTGSYTESILLKIEGTSYYDLAISHYQWVTQQIITITEEEEEIDEESIYPTDESSSDLRTSTHEKDGVRDDGPETATSVVV